MSRFTDYIEHRDRLFVNDGVDSLCLAVAKSRIPVNRFLEGVYAILEKGDFNTEHQLMHEMQWLKNMFGGKKQAAAPEPEQAEFIPDPKPVDPRIAQASGKYQAAADIIKKDFTAALQQFYNKVRDDAHAQNNPHAYEVLKHFMAKIKPTYTQALTGLQARKTDKNKIKAHFQGDSRAGYNQRQTAQNKQWQDYASSQAAQGKQGFMAGMAGEDPSMGGSSMAGMAGEDPSMGGSSMAGPAGDNPYIQSQVAKAQMSPETPIPDPSHDDISNLAHNIAHHPNTAQGRSSDDNWYDAEARLKWMADRNRRMQKDVTSSIKNPYVAHAARV